VLAAVAAALLASERANADALDRTVGAGALSATIEPDPFRIKIGALDGLAGVVRRADRARRITIVGWVRHLFVHASKARLVVPACPAKR
jgi:hypothetical protein